ncbi:hypothetical protein AB0399_36845, partial [Streptomyces sp. NPDC088194]|uniref:hypothetical protein n=1 Tax=Streptomyces sp. NPDC088194 TaxID=3154931 RepID=UPI00344B342E
MLLRRRRVSVLRRLSGLSRLPRLSRLPVLARLRPALLGLRGLRLGGLRLEPRLARPLLCRRVRLRGALRRRAVLARRDLAGRHRLGGAVRTGLPRLPVRTGGLTGLTGLARLSRGRVRLRAPVLRAAVRSRWRVLLRPGLAGLAGLAWLLALVAGLPRHRRRLHRRRIAAVLCPQALCLLGPYEVLGDHGGEVEVRLSG